MVNKTQIRKLLKDHFNVYGKITIDAQGAVSCTGDIQVQDQFSQLPVRFDRVQGSFSCIGVGLTTLEGVPRYIGGSFSCQRNKLTNLTHAPVYVHGNYEVWMNRLTSLKGAPWVTQGDFYCGHNKLTTLAHAPSHVAGSFDCLQNPLNSLDHAPQYVGEEFWADYHAHMGLLRMLVTQKLILLKRAPAEVQQIMNKYKGQGKAGAIKCAGELIKAGFRENARW